MARIFSFHRRQRSKRRCWRQTMYCFRAGSWGLRVRGRSSPVAVAKILPAVFAIAHAAARPAVGEDAVGLVFVHDLFVDRGHEFEVVRAERAGFPITPDRRDGAQDGRPRRRGSSQDARRRLFASRRGNRCARPRSCPARGSPQQDRRMRRDRRARRCASCNGISVG